MGLIVHPPDGMAALVLRLNVLHEAQPMRAPGAVLPYYLIWRPGVTDDQLTEFGTYRVESFDKARDDKSALLSAYDVAMEAHEQVLSLCPRFGAQQPVEMPDGTTVCADKAETRLGPIHQKYTDDGTIERWIADYEIHWRYQ